MDLVKVWLSSETIAEWDGHFIKLADDKGRTLVILSPEEQIKLVQLFEVIVQKT